MKLFSDEAQAALERGDAMVSAAIEILCDPVFRVFGGYGVMTIAGFDYTGIGDRGLVEEIGQALGGSSQALELSLSGVEQAVADGIDADALRGAAGTVRKLIVDGSGTTLLDASIYGRGRVDQVTFTDTPGGTTTIKVNLETAARALGRSGGRMRSDADQRLINPSDGSCRHVSYAGEKMLYWGGKPPNTARVAFGGGHSVDGPTVREK